IVYICPEMIDLKNKAFIKLAGLGTKKSVFATRLCGLIIDEAHLVYVWRYFRLVKITNYLPGQYLICGFYRSAYSTLSRLRSIWPKVPIMTLSATFVPHVAFYVHKSLELMRGTKLIRKTIDRTNVYLARREMTN
ncbi:hypothetical protein L211DRAFT_789756, partial [Terfezia boudieri ATCC MYA-4762]